MAGFVIHLLSFEAFAAELRMHGIEDKRVFRGAGVIQGCMGDVKELACREWVKGSFMANLKFTERMAFRVAVLPAFFAPMTSFAQDAYADPAGSGVLVSAVQWLQGTLLGTVATVVAVIAVAAVGFLMLTGRINWRYGATVILGCFILFGAASIVAGIQSAASAGY